MKITLSPLIISINPWKPYRPTVLLALLHPARPNTGTLFSRPSQTNFKHESVYTLTKLLPPCSPDKKIEKIQS